MAFPLTLNVGSKSNNKWLSFLHLYQKLRSLECNSYTFSSVITTFKSHDSFHLLQQGIKKWVNASFKAETENMPENKTYKGGKTNLDSELFGKNWWQITTEKKANRILKKKSLCLWKMYV